MKQCKAHFQVISYHSHDDMVFKWKNSGLPKKVIFVAGAGASRALRRVVFLVIWS